MSRPPHADLDAVAGDLSAYGWTCNSLRAALRTMSAMVSRAQKQAERAATPGIAEGCRLRARAYDDARQRLQLDLDLLTDARRRRPRA